MNSFKMPVIGAYSLSDSRIDTMMTEKYETQSLPLRSHSLGGAGVGRQVMKN